MGQGDIFEKFSGKFQGIYRGKVIDNDDSSQWGRCKIQVYPMFSEITEAEELPWAVPAMSLFVGAGEGTGSFCIPEIGSFVFCFFEEGNIYQPVYFAEAQTGGKGLPSERTTNYPTRKVWKTSNGIVFYVDDTTKEINITVPGNYTLNVVGDVIVTGKNITITGSETVNINPI